MNADRSEKPAEVGQAAAQFDGEISDFIRRNVTALRRPQPAVSADVNNVNTLIQRVAGISLSEIENLIEELRGMRDFLEGEGERVQREIAGFTHLSKHARSHLETMADHMAQWKAGMAGAEPGPA